MKENGKKFILCRALGSVDDAASGLRCFTWTERVGFLCAGCHRAGHHGAYGDHFQHFCVHFRKKNVVAC